MEPARVRERERRPAENTLRRGDGPLEIALYWVSVPLLHAAARLPLRALYVLSDLACFLLYRVFRVRRRVLHENLRGCFPEAPPEEIERLARRTYRNHCDIAAESLRCLVASPEEIVSRIEMRVDIARKLRDEGRSAIYVMGHNGNWEWAIPATAAALPGLTLHVVYHPIAHAGFDGLFRRVRERFGAILTPMDEAPRAIVGMRRRRLTSAVILVADQRPPTRSAYRTTFLGRETGFLSGPDRLARRLDLPVVFVEMLRVDRGRYRLSAEWLCEHPAETQDGEITERYARRLERQICEAPDDWLWLHRRWRDRRAERTARLVSRSTA